MPRVAMEPDERRQMLVDVALALFLEQGFAATSVADIVRRAGVAQGTFYYHFESKDAIATAVVTRMTGPLLEAVFKAAEVSSRGPAERLMAGLDTLLGAMQAHCEVIARLIIPANDLLHARFGDAVRERLLPFFVSLVEAGRRDASFRVADPAATAEMLLAALPHLAASHAGAAGDHHVAGLRAATRAMFRRTLGLTDPDSIED